METKPNDSFCLKNSNRLKTCKECYNKKQRENYKVRYKEDEEYRLKRIMSDNKSRWKYRYGVEVVEVLNTLQNQEHKCANPTCGRSISLTSPKENEYQAVIDHNHDTGKFRALLCQRCNIILGNLESNPILVKGLQIYMKNFNKTGGDA